jgi:hypothetical protein
VSYSCVGDTHLQLAYLCFRTTANRVDAQNHFADALACYKRARAERWKGAYAPGVYPWPETKLGIILSSPINETHHLTKAIEHFEEARDDQGNHCKHAKYWLGRAYLNGFGVKRDVDRGLDLIWEAASGPHQVLRALFEIGYLLEVGVDGRIPKNHVLAAEYYETIALRSSEEADREWISDFARTHMMDNKDYHDRDNALDDYAGNVISWEFAGQAFLFAAFATLVPITYNPPSGLKISLAVIGMYVAVLSVLMSIHTLLQHNAQLRNLMRLYEAKLGACEVLAGPSARPQFARNLIQHSHCAFAGEVLTVFLHVGLFAVWLYAVISYS